MGLKNVLIDFEIVFPILAFVALTILMFQVISAILGRNIFKTTARQQIAAKNREQQFKRNLTDRYIDLIYKIRDFKVKYRLFGMDPFVRQDKDIVLERTNQRITPDSPEVMQMDIWDAIHTLWSIIAVVIALILLIILPWKLKTGALIGLIIALIFINIGHFSILKTTVTAQNEKMTKAFGDFYLTQHNILMTEKSHPFKKGLEIYRRIARDPFMKEWTETTLNLIEQSDEQTVIEHYQNLYRDLPVMVKLMSLEHDLVVGSEGDPYVELVGMREQILEKKKRDIETEGDKKAAEVNATIMLVYIIVAQASLGFIVMTLFPS